MVEGQGNLAEKFSNWEWMKASEAHPKDDGWGAGRNTALGGLTGERLHAGVDINADLDASGGGVVVGRFEMDLLDSG